MLRVALTGGIATGKSYALSRFSSRGVPTIDADRLVHDAFAAGTTVSNAVASSFGRSVVASDGSIDRRRLGEIVFADQAARRDLEAIVHPVVYTAISEWFAGLGNRPDVPFAVADIPLLYEPHRAGLFDRIIVAACDAELQVSRIMARDDVSEDAARQRLATQWPIADKVQRADFVIRTDGSKADTDRQVDEIARRLSD